jgi:hypothetical protein
MNQTEAEKFADERKKRLIKYFIEAPDPQDCTFAMALLGTAVCLAAGAWTIHNLYGLQFAVGALLIFAFFTATSGLDKFIRYRKEYAKSHPRPSDDDMDLLLGDEIRRAQSTALENLEITSDDLDLTGNEWDPLAELETRTPRRNSSTRRPLVVFGPHEDARAEAGRDGLWRFSEYHVMAICPTHFSLGIYLCTIDILTGAMGEERTYEYHYDDVVAILTSTVGGEKNSRLLPDGKFHFARTIRQELQIIATSGDNPTIPVVVPGHGETNRATVERPEIENVIASVRRVLRDRKNNVHLEGV